MNCIGMFEYISESDVPNRFDVTVFDTLDEGDSVVVFAWGGGDEHVKAEFTVTGTQRDQTESDDIVSGTINGNSATLRFPWRPADPQTGIRDPYPELPIHLEYQDDSYDVVSITE